MSDQLWPLSPSLRLRKLKASLRWAIIGAIASLLISGSPVGSAAAAAAGNPFQPAIAGIWSLQRDRLPDLKSGFQRGLTAFQSEIKRGAFVALTGVEPRQPLALLEGATFINRAEGTTFVLADGTRIPPLSPIGYDKIRETLPPDQRSVLDDKFFWLLQRNPAVPLIAAGLEQGRYKDLVNRGVFDTDTYYLKPFLGYLFWAAQTANVHLAELLPLVEIHFLTLEHPYFRELETRPEGTVHSFYQYEQDLTNQQYLMRSLVGTPFEGNARLAAIQRVEAAQIKDQYTDSPTTSTTITMGRLPLPTPTAAEDTPGVHALNIAHSVNQGISLLPPAVEQAALNYQRLYQQSQVQKDQVKAAIANLVDQHSSAILSALQDFQDDRLWRQMGLSETLDRRSVLQMDTAHLLGMYATRYEGLAHVSAATSYPIARTHFIHFFQENRPGLPLPQLLHILLSDQAHNPLLWGTLRYHLPQLRPELRALQQQIRDLEVAHQQTVTVEAQVFRQLQTHDLDISTQAFSLLSVAMADRLSDLVADAFQPRDRGAPEYLAFVRGILPFLRDMPDINLQWGTGTDLKQAGLENYVVPDLMALTPEDAPVLTAIASLHHAMVSHNDLNQWDFETLVKVMSTSFNLSAGKSPLALSAEQTSLLSLVDRYRTELRHIAGATGLSGPNALHGMSQQDFRIATWPGARQISPVEQPPLTPRSLRQILPTASPEILKEVAYILTGGSGEFSLSLPLIMLHQPAFIDQPDGTLALQFDLRGDRLTLPAVSQYFDHIYVPAYLMRIALPSSPSATVARALNRLIARTHALYGGYTPATLALPPPLTQHS